MEEHSIGLKHSCLSAMSKGEAWVFGSFNITVSCDFELKRITIDTPEKMQKLKKFLDKFDS